MEPKFILVSRNTVLSGVSDEHDEAGARSGAAFLAKEHGVVSLYARIDTCRTSEPVWDRATSPTANAASAAAFAVGDVVDYSDEDGSGTGEIIQVDTSHLPYRIKTNVKPRWFSKSEVRRPATVPAAPHVFEFGQRVMIDGLDCPKCTFVLMDDYGDCMVLTPGHNPSGYMWAKPNRITPL